MPRYYFDIREGPRFIPDPGGEDLGDLEAPSATLRAWLVRSQAICRFVRPAMSLSLRSVTSTNSGCSP
jgi:hypothetical protein